MYTYIYITISLDIHIYIYVGIHIYKYDARNMQVHLCSDVLRHVCMFDFMMQATHTQKPEMWMRTCKKSTLFTFL